MRLELTDEQLLIQRTARDAAERILAPGAADRDAAVRFPTEELRELAGLGLMGVAIPWVRSHFGRDPAVGSSVLITACTDSGGFFIFLGLATLFLV